MKRVYLIAAAFVLLFFLCGVGSVSAEGRPFVTKWEGKKNTELKIPIFGKDFKLVIKDSKGQVLKSEDALTAETENAVYKFTPEKDGEFIVEAGPTGVSYIKMGIDEVTEVNKNALLEVVQFGDVVWSSMESAFEECQNMQFADGIDKPNLSKVTSMRKMFQECNVFNAPIEDWDVSKVTNMRSLFSGCDAFNHSLDKWDVSNVTDMGGLFSGCYSFNQPLNSWDVSKVKEMDYMFQACPVFNQPLDKWIVSNVTNMQQMFAGCNTFNQPIGNWKVNKVTNMKGTFSHCPSFNQSLNDWDVSNVTTMEDMFHGCDSFNQPLNDWNVSNVTDMDQMFRECTAFNQPLDKWDVSNVTEMERLFNGCTVFNQPLGTWKIKTTIGGLYSTALSPSNYSKTLVDWAAQTDIEPNIQFGRKVGGLVYNDAGKAAREILKAKGWTFEDDRYKPVGIKICAEYYTSLDIGSELELPIEKWGVDENEPVTWECCTEGNISYKVAEDGKSVRIKGEKEGSCFLTATIAKKEGVHDELSSGILVSVSSQEYEVYLVREGKGTLSIENYNPNSLKRELGQEIPVTATPRDGYALTSLMAGTEDILASKKFTVKGLTIVKAVFVKTFKVEKKQEGEGQVTITGAEDLNAVPLGTELTVTATAAEDKGYELKSLMAGKEDILASKKFVVKESTKVTAVFGLKTFPVTKELKGVTKGEISITGAANLEAVEYGTELTVEATTTEEGYELKELQVNGTKLEGKTFKVTGEAKVTAVFALKTFPVTKELKGVTKGEITITGATNLDAVEYGTELTVEATTTEEGYELKELQVNGTKLEGKTFKVTGEAKVTAVFGLKTFPVTKELKGVTKGEITITGATNLEAVEYGTELTVEGATTSEEGYELKELQVNGTKLEGNKFTVKQNTMVTAVFEKKNNPPTPPTPPTPQPNPTPDPKPETFEVTLTQPEHGTLEIEGYTTETLKAVAKGTELKVKATPKNEGSVTYELKELKANGVDIKGTMKFTVTAATTVTARFEKKQGGEDNKDKDPKKPEAVEDAVLASLSVAPNPFTTQLRILNPEGIVGRYELVNQMGAVLRAGVINGNQTVVDTEPLPAGLYFVRLAAQGGARKTLKVYRN